MVTTDPPRFNGKKLPSHMPVPCISGQATKLIGADLFSLCPSIQSLSSWGVSGTSNPKPLRVLNMAIINSLWLYMTPFGIPVVPPV